MPAERESDERLAPRDYGPATARDAMLRDIAKAYAGRLWEMANLITILMFSLAFAIYLAALDDSTLNLIEANAPYLIGIAVPSNAGVAFAIYRLYAREREANTSERGG